MPSSTKAKTLPLTVHNTGFLLERLGQDCHPLQFLRELTQNAIEAIYRTPNKQGEIVWDVDWIDYDLGSGVYKLCITDNGDGMMGEEMVKFINQLSSSLVEQSLSGNYGVGAKIAAATRNHAGLIYLSWKNGQGSMIHLWKDPTTGEYGLRQIERPDGSFGHFGVVEDSVKPEMISEHGTKVILYGNDELEDTMKAPEEAASPSRWIAKYLNSRYFKVPQDVTIRAREGWENPLTDKDRNLLRTVSGQTVYLEQHAENFGKVQLTNAVAHWWILKDENALSQNSGFMESAGHVAALYQNELYELLSGRAGTARLQQFGVIFGHRRVVIYIEPQFADPFRVTSTTARTHLLVNNTRLPWEEWAAEFRDQLPDEIDSLINETAKGASSADLNQSIRDRLKDLLDLYKVSRYRPTPTGEVLIDISRRSQGGQPRTRDTTTKSPGTGAPGSHGGIAGGVYSVFLKRDGTGTPGMSVRPDVVPEVIWVSIKDGTRDQGEIEDRAARFLIEQNKLLINADFRVFTDMIDRWVREYNGHLRGVHDIVQESVRSWFTLALAETVIGIQALKDSKEWTVEEVERALSEEALTAAVMSRYHVNNSVKRELGTKLGKLQPTS
jgi:hypothetical protein